MPQQVIYLQYTNPAAYPPLEHSSRLFAKAGWRIRFLGIKSGAARDLRLEQHDRIGTLYFGDSWSGWRNKFKYVFFTLWAFVQVLRLRASIVYASDMLSTPAALLMKVFLNVPVIYHEHDTPGRMVGGLSRRICTWSRKLVARRAIVCIVPNHQRAKLFRDETGAQDNVVCVWNCPRIEEMVERKERTRSPELRLIYHGSIVEDRLPLTVLEALKSASTPISLKIAGYDPSGDNSYIERLLVTANHLGIEENIEYVGPIVLRADLIRFAAEADVGLALMPMDSADINMRAMVGASNKPFDYLAAGCALIVSDLQDWKQMYVDSGHGLACDPRDAESIQHVIEWMASHREGVRQMGEAGQERIRTEWNYERQFQTVLETINGLACNTRAGSKA